MREMQDFNPIGWHGFVQAAVELKLLCRFDEADSVLRRGLAEFPRERWIAHEFAQVAGARGDWEEAFRRWTEVLERFPDHAIGFAEYGNALRASGRLVEAESLLAEAMVRFPAEPWVAHQYASIPGAHKNWDEAVRRWATVTDRFPAHALGFVEHGSALRASGRLLEADSVLAEAMLRFPKERWVAHQYAVVAGAQKNWEEAVRRWAAVVDRFPDHAAGYVEHADALRMCDRLDDADSVLTEGASRFPSERWIAHRRVLVAYARQDLAATRDRWKQFLFTVPRTEDGADSVVDIASAFRWKKDFYATIANDAFFFLQKSGICSDQRTVHLLTTMIASGAFNKVIECARMWMDEQTSTQLKSKMNAVVGDAFLCLGEIENARKAFYASIECSEDYLSLAKAVLGLACIKLDSGFIDEAFEHVRVAQEIFRLGGHELVLPACRLARSWTGRPPLLDPSHVEVVIFTTAPKRVQSAELKAPEVKLVQKLVDSLRSTILRNSAIPINIFLDKKDHAIDHQYEQNLIAFSRNNDIRLEVSTNNGLRRQWMDAFGKIDSELFLIVEHDHVFESNCPLLEDILSLFNKRHDINYLRLNRRGNIAEGDDVAFHQTQRDIASGVIRANLFSNTPHILRRSFYYDFIKPIIAENEFVQFLHTGAEGIEENVNIELMRKYEPKIGISAISRLLGMVIFGQIGDKAVVRNLGY